MVVLHRELHPALYKIICARTDIAYNYSLEITYNRPVMDVNGNDDVCVCIYEYKEGVV